MSRYKKTKKLFYDKFVYKAAVITPLASSFRGGDLSSTRYQLEYERDLMVKNGMDKKILGNSWNRKVVKLEEIERDLAAVVLFEGITPHHIRVESSTLSFYANDESFLDTLEELYGWDCREIWRPETEEIKEFLLNNPKTILRPEYSHKYKVTVNAINDATAFKEWADKIPKLKVMPRNDYRIGGYFYVADQKTLSLCRLFLGDRIRRVDELCTSTEI